METFDAPFEVKKLTDEGEFRGFASTFGNRDLAGDVIRPGAFKASIANPSRIKMLWSHSVSEIIGLWQSLEETEKGLLAKGQLALGVQRGKEAHELMRMGAVDSLSIGFRVPKNGSQFENETRILTKIDLMEISVVGIPANPQARITEARAAFQRGGVADPVSFERLLYERMRDDGLSRRQVKALLSDGYRGLAPEAAEAADLTDLLASIERATWALQ